ncbi:hypothetical protein REPUB_Repub20aG0042000 [Reevesia pubescens]
MSQSKQPLKILLALLAFLITAPSVKMTEGIEDMCSRFTLTDDEQMVIIVENDCVFTKVWRIQSGLQIREVGDKLFIFHFANHTIKDRILLSQPWAFNRSLLVLKELNGLHEVDKINMEWCPFWVQIHGLPLGLMNKKIGIVVAESLGDVEEVNLKGENFAWGRYLRVMVNLNIPKPLKRGSKIAIEDGKQICMKKNNGSVKREYQSWMRADLGKSGILFKPVVGERRPSSSNNTFSEHMSSSKTYNAEKAIDVEGKVTKSLGVFIHVGSTSLEVEESLDVDKEPNVEVGDISLR